MIFKTDKYLKVNAEQITEHLKTYSDDDVLVLNIEKRRNSRSFLQNNYYWAVLGMVSGHTGHTTNELHAYFGSMFLKVFRLNKLTKKEDQFTLSTKSLNTKQFSNYIEKVRMFANSDLEVYTPTPEEYRLRDNLSDVFPEINNQFQ